jgi:hypothetical protein
MSKVRIFVSFDVEYDGDLYKELLAQSREPNSGFVVLGGSDGSAATRTDSLLSRIREADQLIVICGEHTDASSRVSAELEVAQQERIPYFLLWGRRETMCTKPIGASRLEGMYSWTRQILRDQIALTLRKAAADEETWTELYPSGRR